MLFRSGGGNGLSRGSRSRRRGAAHGGGRRRSRGSLGFCPDPEKRSRGWGWRERGQLGVGLAFLDPQEPRYGAAKVGMDAGHCGHSEVGEREGLTGEPHCQGFDLFLFSFLICKTAGFRQLNKALKHF